MKKLLVFLFGVFSMAFAEGVEAPESISIVGLVVLACVLLAFIAVVANTINKGKYTQVAVILASLAAAAYLVAWVILDRAFDPFGVLLWVFIAVLTAKTYKSRTIK